MLNANLRKIFKKLQLFNYFHIKLIFKCELLAISYSNVAAEQEYLIKYEEAYASH